MGEDPRLARMDMEVPKAMMNNATIKLKYRFAISSALLSVFIFIMSLIFLLSQSYGLAFFFLSCVLLIIIIKTIDFINGTDSAQIFHDPI